MQSNQFDLLKTKRFLPLFITQFMGAFNDNVFKNALGILITYKIAELAHANAQILVTLAAGLFIFPFFLFSATAGQLADKYEKSRLISIIKFAEIILMCCAALGFHLQSIALLMFALFLIGVQATFFGPLKYAILPDHLKENELIAGNGLIEAGTFLAILLGTLLGGLLILNHLGEYLISAIIIIVAIIGFVSSLSIPKAKNNHPELIINYNFIAETFKLIHYSKSQWEIFLSILGISWFWLIGIIFLSEFPVLTKYELHANEQVVNYFIALFSIGIGIGSLLCNRLLKGKVHATYVPLGALGITIFTIDLFFAVKNIHIFKTGELITLSQFLLTWKGWRITFDLILIAICGGLYTVPLYAILQYRSEKSHRARVIASSNIINAIFMVVGIVITMLMLQIGLPVSKVFLIIAILNALVALYICKLLPEVLIRAFFYSVLKFLYRVKVIGIENYRNAGKRVVIIANHTSYLDALLLSVFLPDKLTFAVDTLTAEKWWISLFLRMVDTYPMHPTNPMALKSLIEFIKTDKRCVIFPEGRLTTTGSLMKIYEGPGLVADKANAKLLPIRIQGAQLTPFSRLKGKVRIRWTPKITLTIFPPQLLELPDALKARARRQQISNKLYDLMTEVMFESSNYRRTLFSALLDAKSTFGRKYKIIEDIERNPTSYQQFITRSFILGGLIARKTSPGEYVGILLPNMTSTAITFFALQAYARVPAMLNFSSGAKSVAIACQTAQIKIVLTSLKFVNVMNLADMVTTLKNAGVDVIYLEDLRTHVNIFNKLAGMLMAQFPDFSYEMINRSKSQLNRLDPENTAVVLFTSGSEGTPKGVVLSHKNIQANCFQIAACVDFNSNDKILNALPIFHTFGLMAGTLLPLFMGVKVFFYPSPLHYRIVPELSYDTNSTILFGTDTFLAGYAKHAHQYDFYSIRYVFAGAEKLRHETQNTWMQKFGIRIFEGYGATETSPVLSTNTPMYNKMGTVGRLLPCIKYQLKPIPGISEGGELVVSGPNIMKGYLYADNPGVLVPPEQGWYETGDIVSVDEMGYLSIQGRVKRFAKIAGEMVSLTMVEQQINLLWPEYHHAVIGVPSEKKGEELVLVTTYANANREEIVKFAKENRLAEISVPKKIIILKELPLLGSGKIDYAGVNECLVNMGSEESDEEVPE